MAVYKVAQDVEADDKLIGPFSFRQFIYLIIVALAGALAWGLGQVFIGLAIIPLPVILFFGALALPLRKDQPMEIYLAAILSYYLKPHKRLWEPDGVESLIEITAPKVVEVTRTKSLSEDEAERRLSFLADIADTQGWSVRHLTAPPPQTSMATDIYYAAQQTEDILDSSGGVAHTIDTMMDEADSKRREEMLARMQQASVQPAPSTPIIPATPAPSAPILTAPSTPVTTIPAQQPAAPVVVAPTPVPVAPIPSAFASTEPLPDVHPTFNPYPTEMHQAVIQPLSTRPPQGAAPQQSSPQIPAPTTSETPVSPDIINLASNPDLSIETIQREANRIQKKAEQDDDEVFVSLR